MTKERWTFSKTINIKNRKASYEYQFIDTYIAGIVLKGTEIKSIRAGKVNLHGAYCFFRDGELFIKDMHITPYNQAVHFNHEAKRERKLLLSKRELSKLKNKSQEKGLTIVPYRLFISDRGYSKVAIALAQGKKIHDKRGDIKEKDIKKELARSKY